MNTLFWFLWFLNAALAYFKARSNQREIFGKWSKADRLFWLLACLFGGTYLLAVLLIVDLAMAIGNTKWAKGEARW